MIRAELGVVLGRFQPPHNNHFAEYILPALDLSDHLVIGITNPEPALTKFDATNPHRSDSEANPYTYYHRLTMLVAALTVDYQVTHERFDICPAPINFPDQLTYFLPHEAVYFLTAYDDWGRKKQAELEAQGLKTVMLWEKPESEKTISGTMIRKLMSKDKQWEHLVPPSIATLLK